ncbi:MAG: hypothetical protein ACRCZE_05340, partial [Candidatus Altimarinota bacterium]
SSDLSAQPIAQVPYPAYLKPSSLPTKLNSADPYEETHQPQPIKPVTPNPQSKPGIIREIPWELQSPSAKPSANKAPGIIRDTPF